MPKLPKPNAQALAKLNKLNKIAAKIGERLQQLPIENIFHGSNGYSCAEAGDVTGLNLDKCEIADISFLTDFPGLTHLRLSDNQVADIAPLQALIQKMGIKRQEYHNNLTINDEWIIPGYFYLDCALINNCV